MAGFNLLTSIVIHWNTAHLGEAIRQRRHAGLRVEADSLVPCPTRMIGPHPAHRRIPMAIAPMAVLAYDSAPYRGQPAGGPHIDRFSRCLTYGLQVIEGPHLAGVEFRSLSEDFDTATANGKLQLQMVPAFSE